jgi:hypothetical protein
VHRLFHTLVVCGAGLTVVHCGGQSSSDDGNDDDGSGGSSGTTSTGASTGIGGASPASGATGPVAGTTSVGGKGGAAGSSGAGGLSSGGVGGKGGFGGFGTAGTNVAGSISMGGALSNTEQWFCEVRAQCGLTLVKLETCVVESDRPLDPSDCGDGELFTCFNASLASGDILVNCECVPAPPDDAPCPCPVTTGSCEPEPSYQQQPCENDTSICQCAVTCILK